MSSVGAIDGLILAASVSVGGGWTDPPPELVEEPEWPPLVEHAVLFAMDQPGPMYVDVVFDGIMYEGAVAAGMARLAAAVNAGIAGLYLVDDSVRQETILGKLLAEDVAAAGRALLDMDTRCLVWSTADFGGALDEVSPAFRPFEPERYREMIRDVLPAYRVSLSDVCAGVYRALLDADRRGVAWREQAQREGRGGRAFAPGGYPFGTAIESIDEPELRAEYLERLRDAARFRLEDGRVSRVREVLAEFEHSIPLRLDELYRDAEPGEREDLRRRFTEAGLAESAVWQRVEAIWAERGRGADD